MNTENKSTMNSAQLALIIIAIVVFCLFLLIPIGRYINVALGPNPPRPTITYGEFPFRLEYEINGEVVVVEDTVICKFDGFRINTDGKSLQWKQYLASNKREDSVLLLKADIATKIYYTVGAAMYYMDADKYLPEYSIVRYDAIYVTNNGSGLVSAEKLFNNYGIRIISFEPSERIKNTFK